MLRPAALIEFAHIRHLMVILISFSLPLSAAVVETFPGEFTVLSGGKFRSSSGVTIDGTVGTVGNTSLGARNSIGGDVYSNGRLHAARGSDLSGRVIASDNVNLGINSQSGDIDSYGRVVLNRNTRVNGNLAYGTGFRAHPSSTVTGQTHQGRIDFWNPTMPGLPGFAQPINSDLKFSRNSQQSLLPGSYGNLKLESGSTVYLSAGAYNFDNVFLANNVRLLADTSQGEVSITAVGRLTTLNNVEIVGSDPTNELLIYSGDNLTLGGRNLVTANLVSYHNLRINQNSQITGIVYSSGDTIIGRDVTVSSRTAIPPVASSIAVPEPASILLLTTAVPFLIRRYRRRNSNLSSYTHQG